MAQYRVLNRAFIGGRLVAIGDIVDLDPSKVTARDVHLELIAPLAEEKDAPAATAEPAPVAPVAEEQKEPLTAPAVTVPVPEGPATVQEPPAATTSTSEHP